MHTYIHTYKHTYKHTYTYECIAEMHIYPMSVNYISIIVAHISCPIKCHDGRGYRPWSHGRHKRLHSLFGVLVQDMEGEQELWRRGVICLAGLVCELIEISSGTQMHGKKLAANRTSVWNEDGGATGQLTALQQNQFGRRGNELHEPRKKMKKCYHSPSMVWFLQEGLLVTFENIKTW